MSAKSRTTELTHPRSWEPIALLLLVIALVAMPASTQSSRYEDTTDVVVIEVPVHVTKGGEPVRGLTADNFELIVDRKKQKLLSFDAIDLSTISAVPAVDSPNALPVVARRHFLLLFDLSFAEPAGIIRSQDAARKLVLDGLHPTDLVGVGTYNEAIGAQVVLGFTSDRRQIDLALATLGNINPAERIRDPLGIMLVEHNKIMELGGFQYDLENKTPKPENPERVGGYETTLLVDSMYQANLVDRSAMSGIASRSEVRNQILALSSAFSELADHLASVDGRKHIVYFSEGFDSSSLLGTDDTERTQELNQQAASGEFWRVDSDERYGDLGTQQGVFDMLDHFKRCDCTIQAVDTGGFRDDRGFDQRASGEDSLFVMADQTGGELYRNYNDLSEAMASMLDRTSLTYLLSWQTSDPGKPGQFYPIRVKLKGAPKGARLVHRPGYYAPKPYGQLTAEERRFETIELMMEGREGGTLDASLLAVPFKVTDGKADVLTLLEIEGYSLLRGHQGSVVPTEVFAYAINEEGGVSDFMGQAIELDLEKVQAALDSRGFKFLGHLELGPGKYEVRVLVRNALTGATGIRIAQVEVPEFSETEPALAPPLFIEPDGTWLIGQQDGSAMTYPLMHGQQSLVPSARPILPSSVQVPVLLVGHNLGQGQLSGDGKLVPLDGSDSHDVALTVKRRSGTAVAGVERIAATLGPGGAPPGEYRLEVTLRGSEGGEVTSTIPVRVY
jgi:VWFA-related protein